MANSIYESARIAAGILRVAARRLAVGRGSEARRRGALVWLGCVAIVIWMGVIQSSHATAEELTPAAIVDMFFKTLERQGRNPRVIESGDISYEEYSQDNTSVEDRQAADREYAKRLISDLETRAKESVSDLEQERWRQEVQRIRKEGATTGAQTETPTVWVKRDVFVGNNPRKRSREEAVLKVPSSNGSLDRQVLLCEYDGVRRAFLSRRPESRNASLSTNAFEVSSIEYCGRARSPMALATATLFMAHGGNYDTFTFSPSTIASLEKVFESAAATAGVGVERIPHLVEVSSFEGHDVYKIEYGMREPIWNLKIQARLLSLTVDPSRGYIVPVEEEYHNGKRVIRLESSDYRQSSKDGLWFPWQSKETHYNPATGDILSEHVWQVTAAVLNDPIDPKEFEVAIPAGESIQDSRESNVATSYSTNSPVTIGANLPRGDLSSIPGVTKTPVLTGRFLPEATAWSWTRKLWLAGTGAIVLILIGMVIRKRQRMKMGSVQRPGILLFTATCSLLVSLGYIYLGLTSPNPNPWIYLLCGAGMLPYAVSQFSVWSKDRKA
jgi:hypothetical protein